MDDDFLNPEGGAANISPLTNDPLAGPETFGLELEVLKGRINEIAIMLAEFFNRHYRMEGYTDGNGNLRIGIDTGGSSGGRGDGSQNSGI